MTLRLVRKAEAPAPPRLSPRAAAVVQIELGEACRSLKRAMAMLGARHADPGAFKDHDVEAHKVSVALFDIRSALDALEDAATISEDHTGGRFDLLLEQLEAHVELCDQAVAAFGEVEGEASLRRCARMAAIGHDLLRQDLGALVAALRGGG